MKKLLVILLIAFPFAMSAQMTYIPDDNFEQALIDWGYDKGTLNDSVPTANIDTVTSLYISSYNILNLSGIEAFRSLRILDCSSNRLKILDISRNTSLIKLWCHFNQLMSLDVINNRGLRELGCTYNKLTSLDLSKNPIMEFMNASNNPNLTCIQVVNPFQANNNPNWKKDSIAKYALDCNDPDRNMTYVPDDNFERALIEKGYDSGPLNDSVPTKNIDTVINLDISSRNIFDLTGIEDFCALDILNCSDNRLTRLDISKNSIIEVLNCYHNKLRDLDISNNIQLNELNCFDNRLTNLALSTNPALKILNCSYNQLLSLDISKNSLIIVLNCSDNNLTSLDLSINFDLIRLDCSVNKLLKLDLSKNISLRFLRCFENQLTGLDITNNFDLYELYCYDNKLTSLDIGNNPVLVHLSTRNNPNLFCIQVINSSEAYLNLYWYKDDWTIYSEDCGYPGEIDFTYVPDDNFEQALINLGYDSGPLDDSIPTANIDTVIRLNINNRWITDLTGIEDFVALERLYCHDNNITSLDLSKNSVLANLDCSDNQLRELNISKNSDLTFLDCSYNYIQYLDISNNLLLYELECEGSHLGGLDLRNNSSLTILRCDANYFTKLDISKNTSLRELYCMNNLLKNLNISQNPDLEILQCYLNELKSLDISKNLVLAELACDDNNLITLDLSNNLSLERLSCTSNHLTSLDVSKNISLRFFYCLNNPNLNCIQVKDSLIAAREEYWRKDSTAVYSEDCSTVGVDEDRIEYDDISLSPNPASDYIEINYNVGADLGLPKTSDLTIFNSLGECVFTPLAFGEGTGVRLDISPLPPGVYFIRIGNENHKFIKF